MEQFKRVKVVMLPTEKGTSSIAKSINQDILSLYNKNDDKYNQWINQHLYILSDDEIEETDWFILLMDYGLHELHNRKTTNIKHWDNNYAWTKDCKKIIATTDISLTTCQCRKVGYHKLSCKQTYNLPEPSQSFIQKFIEEYNKGNVITDVMVEYESIGRMKSGGIETNIIEITIKKLKDSWNREEVIKLLKLLKKDTINSIDLDINTDNLICDLEINKWIEKNL